MFRTLSNIGENLNKEGILWAVGASIVLNHYGLVQHPNDIDLLVDVQDMEKADRILQEMGQKKGPEKTDVYATQYFYEYMIKGFDVDVMAGFEIKHSNGSFQYKFDENSISTMKEIHGISIPLTSLEDWYILYQLIPHREHKVQMIENYLLSNGIGKRFLMERTLAQELPREVRCRIENLLAQYPKDKEWI